MPVLRLLVLALAVVAPQGSRWKDIGTTSTGNPVQIDPKSVKTAKDGIITASFRVPYAKPFDHPKGKVTVTRAVAMFNCGARTVAVKESTMYLDEKAGRIAEKSVPKIPGFGPSFSSTFSGVALDYLCPKK
ncbi:MAG: hypothetical protein HYR75_06840 [Gemmatimonadetes bacterium]|nr:hypothetical protein [Gemmatimonadota bacterium]MBI3566864.1 hypothetical protein [Gemmatimonadota bacterium]